MAYAVAEGTPVESRLQLRGEPQETGAPVPRRAPRFLAGDEPLNIPGGASGRQQFAEWLTRPENPLTARVMVNRIWQHHFGKGLVATPNDFGSRGERPVNPELLDYLASRFRESGYSIKAMHKLMVMTRAYQMASGQNERNASIDAKNEYLWRFDRRRLDAEEIRDAMLAVSANLDRAMGGKHPFPPETTFKYTQHVQFFATYETKQRGVYLMQQRQRKHPWLEAFDGADPNASTPIRTAGQTSIQALAMMNSAFVEEQSDALAVRVGLAYTTEADRIAYAFRLAYGRAPAPDEIRESVKYLADARAALKESALPADRQPRAALASLMHVLLSSDEFVFVD
jgi:hypothetical protein